MGISSKIKHFSKFSVRNFECPTRNSIVKVENWLDVMFLGTAGANYRVFV